MAHSENSSSLTPEKEKHSQGTVPPRICSHWQQFTCEVFEKVAPWNPSCERNSQQVTMKLKITPGCPGSRSLYD